MFRRHDRCVVLSLWLFLQLARGCSRRCQGGADDERTGSLVGQLGSELGSFDADSTAIVFLQDGKKYAVDGIDSAAAIQKAQKDFVAGAIDETIKSAEETFWQNDGYNGRPHAEPMLPGVRRVTTKNFQKVLQVHVHSPVHRPSHRRKKLAVH